MHNLNVYSKLLETLPEIGPVGKRKLRAAVDIEYFAKTYFPELFPLEIPQFHKTAFQLLNDISNRSRRGDAGKKIAIAFPRGHSKTTIFSRITPIHSLLFRWSLLTILIGNNDRSAKRLLKNIKEDLETNELLKEDFPILSKRPKVWGSLQIQLSDGSGIAAFGRGSGAIRGVVSTVRPRLVIGDDLEDDQSVRSEIETEALIDWWNRAVLAVGDNVNYTTTYILVGTVLVEKSLFMDFANRPGVKSVILPAIRQFPSNLDLWDRWAEVYTQNPVSDPDSDSFYQDHKEALLADAELLWNRPDALWHLMQFRLTRGERAFQTEMQNNPFAARDTPLGELPIADPPSSGFRIAALDPAIKGRKKTADYPAYVELVFDFNHQKAVLDFVLAEKVNYGEVVIKIANRIASLSKPLDALVVEENSAGSVIADLLQQKLIERKRPEIVTKVYNSLPKSQRIGALAIYARTGQFAARPGVSEEFEKEWKNYPAVRNDDVLDAVSTAMNKLAELGLLRRYEETDQCLKN